jgi:peroxiredoxin Q/BCP
LDFNALLPKFKRAGATVLGVSRDSLKSHQNFCAKQGFTFDLVSDADSTLCNAFGVIQPKKLYGREYLGIVRSTYLIDPTGVIRQQWQPVKLAGHAQAVLDALQAAQAK